MPGVGVRGVGVTGGISLGARIAALFRNSEQAVWFDPPDISTLYQDAAGTTPVTAMEQPVGLMLDKSKGLVLGTPLTISSIAVTPIGGTAVDNGDGTYTVSGGGYVRFYYNLADLKQGAFYKVEVEVLSGTGSYLLQWCDEGNTIKTGAGVVSVIATHVYDSTYRFVDFEGCSTDDVTFKLLSVRELPGNHAYQSTSASRPVLSARVNMLTYTEDFSNAAWLRQNTAISGGFTSPTGTLTAQKIEVATNASVYIRQSAVVNTTSVMASVYVKKGSGATAANRFVLYNVTTSTVLISGTLNYDTGAWAYLSGSTGVTVAAAAGGWWRVEISTASGITAGNEVALYVGFAGVTENAGTHLYAWGADLRQTNAGVNLPPYQRVAASTDYDTAGFPAYLKFDGIDDFLVTNSIDFTSTDKMTVCAGVRKLSDATTAMLLETSASILANNGSIYVLAPTTALPNFGWASKGTSAVGIASANTFAAPITNVLTGIGNISGDSAILRINGTQATYSTADQGTGNYGNYPLYIGSRAGTSLCFNGHLYGLIVRGAQSTDAQIASVERYVNGKTKAYT